MELSDKVSWSDVPAIKMLSRSTVERIATLAGVPYPDGATKGEVITLIEASHIDVMDPKYGLVWERVNGQNERGQDGHFIAPVAPRHKSAREGVDSSAILQQRLTEAETQSAETEDKNTAQADEIKSLREQVDNLLSMVKSLQPKTDQPPPEKGSRGEKLKEYHALVRQAKAAGITVPKGTKLPELERLLESANA